MNVERTMGVRTAMAAWSVRPVRPVRTGEGAIGRGFSGKGRLGRFVLAAALAAILLATVPGLFQSRPEAGRAMAGPDPAWQTVAARAAGMVVDARGTLYLADAAAGAVRCLFPDGEEVVLAEGVADLGGLAVDARRTVYVSSTSEGVVYRIAPNGERGVAARGLRGPTALAVDRDGGLYVALRDPARVIRISRQALDAGVVEAGIDG